VSSFRIWSLGIAPNRSTKQSGRPFGSNARWLTRRTSNTRSRPRREDHREIDPIIRGLLARLPKSGDVWPDPARKLWLNLLEGSFKLIYKDAPASGKAAIPESTEGHERSPEP
jgi:hypothetical protein